MNFPTASLAAGSGVVPGGIVVLDFGGQYTQLIARRVREMGVFSIILPCWTPPEDIRSYQPAGIILSGGPTSVHSPEAPPCDKETLEMGLPILGICYGLQWITHILGGKVEAAEKQEYGPAELEVKDGSALLAGLPSKFKIWNSHGDHITEIPPGFTVTGTTANSIAAIESSERKMYAVQFHPEVRHTAHGPEMLRNFVIKICGANTNWSPQSFVERTIEEIRRRVGPKAHVVCGLSGGVDSTVAATLVHRAIGDRLTSLFVDNGLLRHNEFEATLTMLRDRLSLHVVGVDAAKEFLDNLQGVTDPEQKRKRIGTTFIRVFETEAAKLGDIQFLVQGTLYPDVIESVSVRGPSQTIKTHHNVGGLPADLKFTLIEPLRELFKDEVRRIGKELELPDEVLLRQPFPGPGLAVRILGEITPERLDTLRKADRIVVEEIRAAGLYEKIWQSFAVLLPVMTVGVMGDQRTYANVVAIRAVESDDGMTADWVRLPGDLLEKMASRIVNEVPGVNRVVYDISSKPPGTIEWE